MPGFTEAFDWGKKILQLNGRVEKNLEEIGSNTNEIKLLKRQLLQLATKINNLQHQLELERQSNAHSQQKYQDEIRRLETEISNRNERYQLEYDSLKKDLELRLRDFQIEMMKLEQGSNEKRSLKGDGK